MTKKLMMMVVATLAVAMAAVCVWAGMTAMADSPMVSNVTAKQRWPWNGMVNPPHQIRLQREGKAVRQSFNRAVGGEPYKTA